MDNLIKIINTQISNSEAKDIAKFYYFPSKTARNRKEKEEKKKQRIRSEVGPSNQC